MDIHSHMKVASGLVTTSGVGTVIGFFSKAIPVLQVMSLMVAIASGVLGMFWIAYQFRRTYRADHKK